MADGYDRFDNEGSGGGSFVMGLLTGTVLGAGLGMLFAPKAGSELRSQLSEQAGNLANNGVGAGYRKRAERNCRRAGRNAAREMYDKARDAVGAAAPTKRSATCATASELDDQGRRSATSAGSAARTAGRDRASRQRHPSSSRADRAPADRAGARRR